MGRLRRGIAPLTLAAAVACARSHAALPADPGVTFAAHRDGPELVVDRLASGASGVVGSAGGLRAPGTPDRVLRVDGEVRAALWIIGQSRVLVRDAASTIAPRAGEAISSWDGGAIRLTLYTRDGSVFGTSPFARIDPRAAGAVLTREARGDRPSVDGTYR